MISWADHPVGRPFRFLDPENLDAEVYETVGVNVKAHAVDRLRNVSDIT
jgi:hypothetical protein